MISDYCDYTTTANHTLTLRRLDYCKSALFVTVLLCRSICKAGPELIDATGHDIPSLLESILKLGGHIFLPAAKPTGLVEPLKTLETVLHLLTTVPPLSVGRTGRNFTFFCICVV